MRHGQSAISKQTLTIAGIVLNVFSQPDAATPADPVAVLFLLHGRLDSAQGVETVARTILDDVHARRTAAAAGQKADDLIVVSFVSAGAVWVSGWTADTQGVGCRTSGTMGRGSWTGWRTGTGRATRRRRRTTFAMRECSMGATDINVLTGSSYRTLQDRHVRDTECVPNADRPVLSHSPSTLAGTAQDVSFLIDFLPAYLFPNDERTVSQWLVSGISLGGHASWITLRNGAHTLCLCSLHIIARLITESRAEGEARDTDHWCVSSLWE